MKLPETKLLRLSAIYGIILAALIVITIIVTVIIGNKSILDSRYSYENKTEIFNASEISEIDASVLSGKITVSDSQTDEIMVILNGESNHEIKVSKYGSILSIREGENWLGLFSLGINIKRAYELTILVPSTYNKNINLDTISNEISVNNININLLKTNTVSGNTNFNNIVCADLGIDTVSGSLYIDKITTDKIDVNLASGELNFKNISANELIIDQVSGDSNIGFVNSPRYINIDSISGDNIIDLPDDTVINLDSDTLSGDVTNTLTTSPVSSCVVKLNTISGDTNIH